MPDADEGESAVPRSRSKVVRLMHRYDMEAVGDELESSWTTDGDGRRSLRDLAAYFNHRLLESAMEDAGVSVLDGEVENVYRLLTDDDVSSGTRVQARNRLERDGIDVDVLEEDFVSRQAIHTYLTKYRAVESPTDDDGDRVETARETIQQLRNRVVAVAEGLLSRLDDDGRIVLGEFTIFVTIQVRCTDCNTQRAVADLLANGGCACERPSA